jgi:ATP-dependent exoDNAse (exonuclease V) beta subunit
MAARDRDVLLQAGAGTGKTRVLADRYCAAICEDGLAVDQVLAFTFTERAAAELRRRVRGELARRACEARGSGERDLARELRAAARETERAWVTTIHAFCRRVLAAHPVAAGLDPRFRVLDEPEAARLRERATQDAIDALIDGGDERVTRAAAAYRRRLGEMALAVHERQRSLGSAAPRLPTPPEPASVTEGDAMRAALAAVVEELARRYRELKLARAGLDFSDLELGALNLLRSSAGVREVWRGRFDHVMLDEFQDTNRVQLELVEELRGPETRVFRVGDANQSIYRFRNADVEVFIEERARVDADPASDLLPLRGNFRSLPSVLAAVNMVGRTLLPEFEELTAARTHAGPSPGPDVELLLTLDEGRARGARSWRGEGIELEPPPAESQPAIVAEARALAQRLRALVDSREAQRADVVVLLRAFTHVDAYEDALRRAGLRPYVVGGRGYWSQQQVEDLVRLLGVLANPLDDDAVFGALASPACGASADALWLLRAAAGDGRPVWPLVASRFGDGERPRWEPDERWLAAIPAEDAARLESFCRRLAGLRAEAPLRALDDLVERTMSAFGYDLALLARPGGPGRMANVRKLMRLAREFEEHEGRDLRGFLAAAAASTRRDEREGMAPVQAEGHDGVRIMTVHAAKGLEFPVVAVPDLGRALDAGHRWSDVAIRRRDGGEGHRFGMRLASPAAASENLWELHELLREEQRAEAQEGCRLVYVAATRARDRLLLSGVYRPADVEPLGEPDPSNSPMRRILPALVKLGWDGGAGHVALPAAQPAPEAVPPRERPSLRVSVSEPSPERAAQLRERHPEPPEEEASKAPAPPPLIEGRARRVPVGHLSYSALAAYERCGYRFYVERVLGLRGPGAPVGGAEPDDQDAPERESDELVEPVANADALAGRLGFGSAVHAALEWSARGGWAEPGPELVSALLAREGLAGDAELVERARSMVGGFLASPLRAELEGMRVRPEAPFALPLGGTIVRGKMDLLGKDGGRTTVIDFKTDAVGHASPAELGKRYAAQRAVYALAAADGGDEVRTVHCFLEAPDEPIVEIFDTAAMAAVRDRLEALVERIRHGEFEVAEDPYAALCNGCPAAARLCSRPAWTPR